MNSRYRYDTTVAGPALNPELEGRIWECDDYSSTGAGVP